MKKFIFLPILLTLVLTFRISVNAQNIGINNPNPHPSAVLDLTGTDKGLLVPRVALTATNVQAPVSGAATSLLVFNTAAAGTGQFAITPGYYYWTGVAWNRLNDDKGSGSNVRSVAGASNATATGGLVVLPQMVINFIAEDTTALIMFSAAGANPNSCGQRSLQFVIRVNGINVAVSQASIEDVANFASNKVWDLTMVHPVQLTPGANTTIEVLWLSSGGCGPISNGPGTVAFPLGSFRTLTVIEPKGSGVFTAIGPPTGIGTNWGVTGNSGMNAATNFIGTTDGNPLQFRTGNLARMSLTATGNLGIGTVTPATLLHVRKTGSSGTTAHPDAALVVESNSNTYAHFLAPNANETGILFSRPGVGSLASMIFNKATLPDGLMFETRNTTRMVIDSIGNVGIGIINPTEKLMVAGNVDATGDLYTGNGSGVINCGGGNMNANINMISDAVVTPLNANGDEDLYIQGVLELGGNGFKPGGGSWATASDARLKKEVVPYTDGLQQVLQIKPVKFKYNDRFKSFDNGKEYVGVIAQEIKEVAPYTVELMQFGEERSEDENGVERIVKQGEEFYSYDSSALTYMLINSVKEQEARIQLLESKIEELIKKR